jgi:hypothetical protein
MKKVALVGHCGPDSSYLRMSVRRADADIDVLMVDDESDLKRAINDGVQLLLLNRELSYGFNDSFGVDLIKRLRTVHPELKMMLVSNYPDAQADAIEAGALPGFGKRELGSPRVAQVVREALG